VKRLAALLLFLPLSSCSREQDGFKPHIVIEQPEAGMVSRSGSTVVKGYAFDDKGVGKIEVNGKVLFVAPKTAANLKYKGERIRRFTFQTSGTEAKLSYEIKVTDVGGLVSTRELPLTVDLKKPTLEIVKAERRNSVTRIAGIAADNLKVRSILVGGSALDLKPAPKREFYIEIPQATVTITVLDAVGNQTSRTIGPLPELEPPPVVPETNFRRSGTTGFRQNSSAQPAASSLGSGAP
jgi:hypothetical protein